MSFTIVIDDAIVAAEQLFSPYGDTIIVPGREISAHAHKADALVIRSRTQITEDILYDNPNIRFIGSTVVGLDHVDLEACQRHNVAFFSAQGCNARSVAEYVISQIVLYATKSNKTFTQLTLGIIGVGHVGSQVEALAHSLGIRCLLNDPPRYEQRANFNQTPLLDLLSQADIITLHTPLTQLCAHPTYQLINQQTLAYIQPKALFINAARGDIVDETALLTRPDLTIITDCWHNEPHINETLLHNSQLATPHIAGHAWDAKFRGGQMVSDALAHWLKQPVTLAHAPASSRVIMPQPSSSNMLQLADILVQAYNFAGDDAHLRLIKSEDIAKGFENYRRNYPIRREWPNIIVDTGNINNKVKQWVENLGLNIRKN